MSKVKVERKALVHAAKDMNEVMGLNPKIRCKDTEGEPIADKEIADKIVKAAKGFNEKKNKFVDDDAASRTDDNLDDETWETLELLGAVEPVAKKSAKKAKKAADEDEDEPKGKKSGKSVKESLKGAKDEPKGGSTRGAGVRAKTFKELKASLEEYDGDTITTLLNKLLLTKQTLGEHIAQAKKEFNYTGSLASHIKYCYEALGYDFIDKRKHKSDEDGIVQLIGMSPDEAKKRTLEMGVKEEKPKSKKAKDTYEDEPKSKKSKKSVKDDEDDDDEPKAKGKGGKKAPKEEDEPKSKKGKGKAKEEDADDDDDEPKKTKKAKK